MAKKEKERENEVRLKYRKNMLFANICTSKLMQKNDQFTNAPIKTPIHRRLTPYIDFSLGQKLYFQFHIPIAVDVLQYG